MIVWAGRPSSGVRCSTSQRPAGPLVTSTCRWPGHVEHAGREEARPRHDGRHEPGAPAGPAAPRLCRRRHGGDRGVGSRPVRPPAGVVGHPPRAPPPCHSVRRGRPGHHGASSNCGGSSDGSGPTSSTPTIPNRASTEGWPLVPPGCAAWSTPCTASMPAQRIGRRGRLWCTPSNARASLCSGAELVQNPEDLAVLARLGVPSHKLVLLGQRRRPAALPSRSRRAQSPTGQGGPRRRRTTPSWWAWWRVSCGRRASASSLRRPRRMRDTHPDVVFVVVGGSDPDKADAISPEELAAARRRGPHRLRRRAGTTWSTSTRPSTSSYCRRTARASPDRPWRRRPAACR